MAETSKIQWTDATWNIAIGCTKVDEDCKFCYMYRQSLGNTRYDPKAVVKTKSVFKLPLKIKEPSKIFTSSLTDVFHEDIDPYRDEMWDIIRSCPHHTFQILTKRPERIRQCLPPDWGEGWDNVWLGTSVGSQKGEYRITELLLAPKAKVKFLSLEPLYDSIDLEHVYRSVSGYSSGTNCLTGRRVNWYNDNNGKTYDLATTFIDKINWVIIGGESGNENGKYRYRPCELHWIEDLVKQCKNHGVSVFVKQLGTFLSKQLQLSDRHGGNIEEFPENLRIREFPE